MAQKATFSSQRQKWLPISGRAPAYLQLIHPLNALPPLWRTFLLLASLQSHPWFACVAVVGDSNQESAEDPLKINGACVPMAAHTG